MNSLMIRFKFVSLSSYLWAFNSYGANNSIEINGFNSLLNENLNIAGCYLIKMSQKGIELIKVKGQIELFK